MSGATQEEEKLSWLREILEWQRDMSDNREFLTLLKSDLDLFSVSFFMAGLCYELACAFVSIGLGLLLAVQLKKQPLRFYVNDAAVFACSIPAF